MFVFQHQFSETNSGQVKNKHYCLKFRHTLSKISKTTIKSKDVQIAKPQRTNQRRGCLGQSEKPAFQPITSVFFFSATDIQGYLVNHRNPANRRPSNSLDFIIMSRYFYFWLFKVTLRRLNLTNETCQQTRKICRAFQYYVFVSNPHGYLLSSGLLVFDLGISGTTLILTVHVRVTGLRLLVLDNTTFRYVLEAHFSFHPVFFFFLYT